MWNVYRGDSFRTNNYLEEWHNCLKRLVGKVNPNIYEFVDVIQNEQTVTEVFVLQLEARARTPGRTLKATNKEKYKNLKNTLILIKSHYRNVYKECH